MRHPSNGLWGALVAASLLLLLTFSATFASPSSVSLSVAGAVVDAGTQTYTVGGGAVGYASVDGYTLDLPATLTFSMDSQVTGLTTTGTASIQLSGTSGAHTIAVDAQVAIGDMVAAADLPPSCTAGVDCTSALPFFFLGASATTVTIDGSPAAAPNPPVFELESPYFNPWGSPIVLTSEDGSIVIVATYTTGTVQWQNTQTSGAVTGDLSGSNVTGTLTIVSNESEDLVAGTATDSGTISLSGMSPSMLDVQGTYTGTSYIPAAAAGSDCSSAYGLPAGTCTETGFQSSGSGLMQGNQIQASVSYSTSWGVPAIGYTSTLSLSYSYRPDPCGSPEMQAAPAQPPTIQVDGPSYFSTPNATNTLNFLVTQPSAEPAAWLSGRCFPQGASSSLPGFTRVAFSVDGGPLQNGTVSPVSHVEYECYTDSSMTMTQDWTWCPGSISVVVVWSASVNFTVMPDGAHTVTLEAWGQNGTGPFETSIVVVHSLFSYAGQPFAISAGAIAGMPIVVKASGLEPMVTPSGTVMLPINETYHTVVPQSGVINGSFLPDSNVTVVCQSTSQVWGFKLGNSPSLTQQLALSAKP